jgi:pimeloyl-ACP methyl ester carboxylesterase
MAYAHSFLAADASEEGYQQLPVRNEGEIRRPPLCALGSAVLACLALLAILHSDGSGATEPTSLAALPNSRPVFLMHGMANSFHDFDQVVGWLREARPGAYIFPVKLDGGAKSFEAPLAKQLNELIGEIRGIIGVRPEAFEDGYDLVCHSQGAVLCRVLCQVMDDHKVHTLVSLAGPQMGVYGKTWFKEFDPAPTIPFMPSFIPDSFESTAYKNFYTVAYTPTMQGSTSVANLWHDPLHEDAFLKDNEFLPFVNGLIGDGAPVGMKANFARLQKAVFLVGNFTDQDFDSKIGLEPWCTGNFAFYAAGSGPGTPCVAMEKQDLFIKDTFGLKSLHNAGRLHVQAVDGIRHGDWLQSADTFSDYVLPHLK